jgi:Ca2+-binding RTX toxin-like protein
MHTTERITLVTIPDKDKNFRTVDDSQLDKLKDLKSKKAFMEITSTMLLATEFSMSRILDLVKTEGLAKILQTSVKVQFISVSVGVDYVFKYQEAQEKGLSYPKTSALAQTAGGWGIFELGAIASGGVATTLGGGVLIVPIVAFTGGTALYYAFENVKISDGKSLSDHFGEKTSWVMDRVHLNQTHFISFNNQQNLTMGDAMKKVINLFGIAQHPIDPIVLDLSGTGLQLVDMEKSAVRFDFQGEGFINKVGWISPNEAFLAIDKNHNGKIDDINELFGNRNISGIDELALFDTNKDGLIDKEDAIYNQLLLWCDVNQDGVSQQEEIFNLTSINISRISLHSTDTNFLVRKNIIQKQFSYFKNQISGEEIELTGYDVSFIVDLTDSIYSRGFIMDSEKQLEAALVAGLRGYGNLTGLEYQMSRDDALFMLVKDIIEMREQKYGSINTLLEQIMMSWAQLEKVDPASRGENINAQQLGFLEQLIGEGFSKSDEETSPDERSTNLLKEAWHVASNSVKANLLIQGPLKQIFNGTYYDYNADKIVYNGQPLLVADIEKVAEQFEPTDQCDAISYWANVHMLASYISNYIKDPFAVVDQMARHHIMEILKIKPNTFGDISKKAIVSPSIGVNTVNAPYNSDYDMDRGGIVIGDNTSNILVGNSKNDILIGLRGHNILKGYGGHDVYVWSPSWGNITIEEDNEIKNDALLIVGNYRPNEFTFKGTSLTFGLKIFHKDTNNFAHILSQYWISEGVRIDDFLFSSGYKTSLVKGALYEGTDEEDAIYASNFDDIIDGKKGEDTLVGNKGDDVYIWRLGDGNDTIKESGNKNNADRIKFEDYVIFQDIQEIVYIKPNGALVIVIPQTNEVVTVRDFLDEEGKVEILEFANNNLYSTSLLTLRVLGTKESEILRGTENHDNLFGFEGNDILEGNSGDDTLHGGKGNDILRGGNGDDIYYWDAGHDVIEGEGSKYAGDHDKIVVSHYNLSNLVFTALNYDVIIYNHNKTESLTIIGQLYGGGIELISFADGEVSTFNMRFYRNGTSGNDNEVLSENGDTVYISKGNDEYTANGGFDVFVLYQNMKDCGTTTISRFNPEMDRFVLHTHSNMTLPDIYKNLTTTDDNDLKLIFGSCALTLDNVKIETLGENNFELIPLSTTI